MRDVHNNPNDHYITRMSMPAQCKLFNTQSHGGAASVCEPKGGNVLLLDRLSRHSLHGHGERTRDVLPVCGAHVNLTLGGTFVILGLMFLDWSSEDKKILRSTIEGVGGMWYTVSGPDPQLPLVSAYNCMILDSALARWDWSRRTEAAGEPQGPETIGPRCSIIGWIQQDFIKIAHII